MTATIWRAGPSCGSSFEQPDDPGRKCIYCSRACQQAAYCARQRTSAGQHSGRQDQRQDWRSQSHGQRHQRPCSERPGAGQRHHQHTGQRDQRRRLPGNANGQWPGDASGDELMSIRRIIVGLLRKVAAPSFLHEAAACREKAEAMRSR